MKKLPTHEYSQGIAGDGAAILKDGNPMTPEQIIEELNLGQRRAQAALDYSNILHDQIVNQQSAWIEWQHGHGADAAMQRIHNALWGPGQIPDEDAPYAKDPQLWYNANMHDPLPKCACGNPSSQLWMGIGACSDECMAKARKITQGKKIKDCPTCKHDHKAYCLSPKYKEMTSSEKKLFWENDNPPCSLWEESEGLNKKQDK